MRKHLHVMRASREYERKDSKLSDQATQNVAIPSASYSACGERNAGFPTRHVRWTSTELQRDYAMPSGLPPSNVVVETGIAEDGTVVWRERR